MFRQQEQVFGDIGLEEDMGIGYQGIHAVSGGFLEMGEQQIAAEQIGGMVIHITSEETVENNTHHQKGQQRRQYAYIFA